MALPEIWQKSSYSNSFSNCVEVAWHKSSASNANGCVETAFCSCGVKVRDSKDKRQDAPILSFTPAAWGALVSGIKAGQFA